jgi:hypothetical protein
VCLTEGACYNVVLELSARLRQAAETLARSPYHANNSTCGLNARVSALDALAKFVETKNLCDMQLTPEQ